MVLKYKTVVFGMLCGLMSLHALGADDKDSRVEVGTRPEPHENLVARLEQREEEGVKERAEWTLSKKHNHSSPSKTESSQRIPALTAAKAVHYTTHPAACQNPVSISYLGDSIELMDGSIWTIAPQDAFKTINWFPTDLIVITPNRNIFSSFSFRLTNQNTGESVAANLYLGPIDPTYGSLYTHWIVAIDFDHNTLYLSDGSIWAMSLFDRSAVNEWMINDVVIIGVNDGWFSNYNPNILINVNVMNYAAGLASY